MKTILFLLLAGSCAQAWAQTNSPAANPAKQQIVTTSDSGYIDWKNMQLVYLGHVLAIYEPSAKLRCGRLTVDMPPNGGHPTNIVAETNVVIDVVDDHGMTTHCTAGKAVYAYTVANSVTNETVTFFRGDSLPIVENPQFTATGDPLVLNLVTKTFGGKNYKTIYKSGGGTNAPSFDFLK
jgi:lipopolysaccharide export system protein LptA